MFINNRRFNAYFFFSESTFLNNVKYNANSIIALLSPTERVDTDFL